VESSGHPRTQWDETLEVYRVNHEIMQRHISDFRSEVKTGNEPSPNDIGIIMIGIHYQVKFRVKIITISYDEGPLPV